MFLHVYLVQDHTSRELLRLVGRFHSLLSEIEDECWIYEKREYNSLKSKKKLVRPKDTYFYRVTMDAVKMTLVSNGTQVRCCRTCELKSIDGLMRNCLALRNADFARFVPDIMKQVGPAYAGIICFCSIDKPHPKGSRLGNTYPQHTSSLVLLCT